MAVDNKEILIIGGGLSGLVLAYRLKQASIPFKLIEARDRIGGRIHTIATSNGGTVEMGATWFADKHRNMISLLQELDIPYESQYLGSKVIYDYKTSQRVIEEIALPAINEPSYIMSHGSESLIDRLYQKLDNRNVLPGEVVESLTFLESKWKVTTTNQILEADIVINTLPPNLFVNRIDVQPQLPSQLVAASKETHTWMGESIKVGLAYEKSLWREKKVGSLFSQYGPITELHDHIHENTKAPILKGFINPGFHDWTKDQRRQYAELQVAMYFKESMELMEYYETDWQNEEFTFQPYEIDVFPHQNNGNELLREPLFKGHLYFAGSETASAYPGYMDGAVERAEEVAEILKKPIPESAVLK